MHVPVENLPRYRRLMKLYDRLEWIGNSRSNKGDYGGANRAWRQAARIHHFAQELRVPGRNGN